MNNIRDIFIATAISLIVLFVGLALLEKHYRQELQKMGWLPGNKVNLYPYGRKISGYTVSENTPNYKFKAYDAKFAPAVSETDSNGFNTGGEVIKQRQNSNAIRIFITGGSTAWGSIESRNVMKDTTYPSGSYCYEATIAGKLKSLLQAKYPQFKFEVVDAAVVRYRFHQSFALYYEKIHDFAPDIIVNIDGQNDMGDFMEGENKGDPYLASMDEMEDELELATAARLPEWPYTLAYYNFKYIRQQGKLLAAKGTSKKPVFKDAAIINHQPDFKSYELLRPYLKISKKMFWLIESYERQLHADGVYSIFCLQPILQRKVYQKQLSNTELRFRTFLEKVTVADTINRGADLEQLTKLFSQQVIDAMGIDKYWIKDLTVSYMFNDLSPVIDSVVTSNGGAYLDVNKAMQGLGSDKEFYVDYCHLTPVGNEFVADLLLKKIEIYMAQKGKTSDTKR